MGGTQLGVQMEARGSRREKLWSGLCLEWGIVQWTPRMEKTLRRHCVKPGHTVWARGAS